MVQHLLPPLGKVKVNAMEQLESHLDCNALSLALILCLAD